MKRLLPLLFVTLALGCGNEGDDLVGSPSEPSEPPPATTTVVVTTTETVTEPARPSGLPPAVESTRQEILLAATERDFRGLRQLIPPDGFTYTYGLPSKGGAVGYWRRIEDFGETPIDTMAGLLALPYTTSRDIYIWPWAYDRDPAQLTDEELDQLVDAGAATREQFGLMADSGHYLGWRLGIRRDGTWVFFVAGD
jgi:hypothetical protein